VPDATDDSLPRLNNFFTVRHSARRVILCGCHIFAREQLRGQGTAFAC
jgi:hypothetical protein